MAEVNYITSTKKMIPQAPPLPQSSSSTTTFQQQQQHMMDMDELSMTLIERRKRLHELANEINQWEDESTKAIALATSSLNHALAGSPATTTTTNQPVPTHTAVSPSPRLGGMRQTSPSPHHYHISSFNSNTNKENRTPTNSNSASGVTANKATTPINNNEILSVAKRILTKKQCNSEPTATQASSHANVKSIASKFENMMNCSGTEKDEESIVQEKLTPRSIIQKFEKLAGGGGLTGSMSVGATSSSSSNRKPGEIHQLNKVSSSQSATSISSTTTTTTSATPRQWTNSFDRDENKSGGGVTTSRPKTIIEKFESLMMMNQQQQQQTTALHVKTSSQQQTNEPTRSNHSEDDGNGGGPSPVPSIANSTSLTYVSSVMESTSAGDYDGVEVDHDDIIKSNRRRQHQQQQQQPRRQPRDNNDRYNRESGSTSLFEEDDDDENDRDSMASTYTSESAANRGDGYSISGSSYTADMMNQDDFDDDDDQQDDMTSLDDESTRPIEDDYDNIDDQTTASEMTCQPGGESEIETTITASSNENTSNYAHTSSTDTPGTSSSESVGGGGCGTSSVTDASMMSHQQQQPLMSLKDYRKQTKTFRSGCGRRRSSMMPMGQQSQKAIAPTRTGDRSTAAGLLPPVALPGGCNNNNNNNSKVKPCLPTIGESGAADETRVNKNLEKIKELEDLIRQEDNTIRQTKDAIECCLSDPQFTGSAQHIECNRLLLISCQKKQAYMSEVTRLRNQIANPAAAASRQNMSNAMMGIDSKDISTSDLTGYLIFSDLKLPVKESFLNKLKSGEEKRQYFFICLLRNGITVLQTQVISTHEILAANDTSIVFPNRMSMSNVDINFRVKIDIYEMEISPKDQQNKKGKHGKDLKHHSSGHHHSKFFVSPFKSTNLGQVIHNTLGGSCSSNGSSAHMGSIHHGSSTANLGTRTSNFIHIDTVEFTNKDLQNTSNTLKFKLNLSSSSIPLMGTLSMSVRCMPSKSIELKGFMTLFEEDMNGPGTWDRRWCFLSNQSISFWKYPEDEYRNGPLGTIYLNLCVNESVCILPRDLCARKHTIELLICESESVANAAEPVDASKCKRYRLSADTREQANDWLTNINFALANLRLWNPKAMKPIKI